VHVKGSIRKPRNAGGTWAYRLDLGVDAAGARQQKQVSGFPTKRAAQAALNEALAGHQRGAYVAPSRETVAEFLTMWVDGVKTELAPSGWTNYRNVIHVYVIPRIGRTRLVHLTPPKLKMLYAELLSTGRRDGSALSPRTVQLTHKILHRALSDAVKWRLIQSNPADAVRAPKGTRREMTVWTVEEASAFLNATAGDRLYALWLVALYVGLRRGELAGLRWKDVDLAGSTLTVAQQRTTADHQVVISEPKKSSHRQLILASETVAALTAHRRRQVAERLAAGPLWEESGYVFVDDLGRPYHPQRLRDMFKVACESAGATPIRLHDLRHTMATMALQAGLHPKVVQEQLGHSGIGVTLDVYSHVPQAVHRDAAARVAALFNVASQE